jgi:peptidoglycan/LPS O-acetylase OafA/YrhL
LILLYDTRIFPPGVLGPELFLVIAGFLVTSLLLGDAVWTGRIGVVGFCRRRLKYAVISLTITVALTTALVYLVGGLQDARRSSSDAVAGLLQLANWHQLRSDGVPWRQLAWDQSGRINPLGHLWLVSLLEQLYLVWPLFVALLWRVCRRSLAAVTVLVWAAFGAAAAVAPVMYDGTNGDRLYLGTDSHAAAFLAGAAAACAVRLLDARGAFGDRERRRRRGRAGTAAAFATVLSAGTLAVLVAASVLAARRPESWLYRGGLAAIAGSAALLAAALCYEQGLLFRVFSWGPLAEFGRVSYLIYLIHLPIYWLLKTTKPEIAAYGLVAVGGGLTWLVAMIMHYGVAERLRLRPWPTALALPVVATCGIVASGAYYLPAAIEKRMNPGGRPVVLTLGDSFAGDVATALADHGSDRFGVVDGDIPGCGVMSAEQVRSMSGDVWPVTEGCRDWERSWRTSIRGSKPQIIVVHLGTDAGQQRLGGRWLSPCDRAYRQRYTAQLERAARVWVEEAPTARVLLMNERMVTATTDQAAARCYNAILRRFAVADPRVTLLDLEGFLCPDRTCRQETPDGEPLYSGRIHLSRPAMGYVAGWLEQAMRRA